MTMLAELATDKAVKARQRITAIKTILMAEALDLKAVETGMKAINHESFEARLEALEAEHLDSEGNPPRIVIPGEDFRFHRTLLPEDRSPFPDPYTDPMAIEDERGEQPG